MRKVQFVDSFFESFCWLIFWVILLTNLLFCCSKQQMQQAKTLFVDWFLSQSVDSFFESICWFIFRGILLIYFLVIFLAHFLSSFVDQFFSLLLKTTNATCEKRNLLTHFWLNQLESPTAATIRTSNFFPPAAGQIHNTLSRNIY